jgi:hypothetical protein
MPTCWCHVAAGAEFMEAVEYVRKVWLPARGLVAEAIKGRAAVDASGRIIVLTKVGVWVLGWFMGRASPPVVPKVCCEGMGLYVHG